jgi:hypothetical protein
MKTNENGRSIKDGQMDEHEKDLIIIAVKSTYPMKK